MSKESSIPQELMTGALLHFEQGVPIDDLHLKRQHKERMARVQHVYWQWMKNPFLDVFPMFKQLVKGKGADVQSEWRMAQKDKWLFDYIVDHVSPPSRRISEARVRAAGNHLMEMGMQTDNGKDISEGAKIIMKLERLDQPEDERADMSRVAFLPPVVTTSAHDVDPTKEDQTDEQARLIMQKYGAYVDEKRKAVDERVAVMMAAREDVEEDNNENGKE